MADSITSESNTPTNNSPSAPLNGSMSKASNSDRIVTLSQRASLRQRSLIWRKQPE